MQIIVKGKNPCAGEFRKIPVREYMGGMRSKPTTQEMARAVMQQTRWTQAEFAREAGVSQGTISRWLNDSKAKYRSEGLEAVYARVVPDLSYVDLFSTHSVIEAKMARLPKDDQADATKAYESIIETAETQFRLLNAMLDALLKSARR